MKKALFILLLIPFIVSAQITERQRPAVYLSYQPADHGLGLRGEVFPWKVMGFYGSGSWGTLGLYKMAGYKNHVKLTAGVLIPVKEFVSNTCNLSFGFNYHYLQEAGGYNPHDYLFEGGLHEEPFSFEAGITIRMERWALALRTDILRWEPCVDLGIPILPRTMRAKRARCCLINNPVKDDNGKPSRSKDVKR